MHGACRHILSPEQLAAATHNAQRLIVLAGPGTGKTHVIASRIVHKIREKGLKPEEILALTFTERATDNLHKRVAAVAESDKLAHDCAIHTFHSFATSLLRTFSLEAGLDPGFRVYNPVEEQVFLGNHLKLLDAPNEYHHPRALSRLLGLFWSIQEFCISSERLSDSAPIVCKMFKSFQKLKRDASILTFPDMIDRVTELLKQRTDVGKLITESYRHILVDEFQDVNPSLMNFLENLTSSSKIDSTIVGDNNQSIFGFRGASGDSLNTFHERYPHSVVIQLKCSFRCPKEVLDTSQRLIQNNRSRFPTPKQQEELYSFQHENNGSVEVLSHPSILHSSEAIASLIRRSVETNQFSFSDICILARTNSECTRLCHLLTDEGLPVHAVGAGPAGSEALRTLISYLRAITQPSDSKALFNVITSNAYTFTSLQLGELLEGLDITSPECSKHRSLYRRIKLAASQSDGDTMKACKRVLYDIETFRDRAVRDGIRKLASDIACVLKIDDSEMERFDERIHRIESALQTSNPFLIVPYLTKLASHGDKYWEEALPVVSSTPHITLMTIHKAKGAEFPLVIISMPPDRRHSRRHQKAILDLPSAVLPQDAGDDLEEDRRLIYVALTRASHRVIFASFARSPSLESRFISEAMGTHDTPVNQTKAPTLSDY